MGSDQQIRYRVEMADLEKIFGQLSLNDYQNIGPTVRDGTIVLDHLPQWGMIAKGFTETIAAGSYHLHNNGKKSESLFQYTLGPQSFKMFLNPPKRKLWSAQNTSNGMTIEDTQELPHRMAFWGIRGCDLAALAILDQVFLTNTYTNPWYKKARQQLFIIAVGCTQPSANCFCTSMGTGPLPGSGYDLLLTEIVDEDHYFVLSIGSKKGQELIDSFSFTRTSDPEEKRAKAAIQKARDQMPVRFNPEEAAVVLKKNPNSLHWEEVANRCLSCANCTMVCPTCFCSSTEDATDLTGDHTERWLRWDSCFTNDFSYIHEGSIRSTTRSKYRQWMTHKLSSWHDQFGTSGCVGCGRCITWCPVGIDLTKEYLAVKQTSKNEPIPEAL